jgi:hypothetical protein
LADHVTLREFLVIPESPTSGGWFLPAGDFNGDGRVVSDKSAQASEALGA